MKKRRSAQNVRGRNWSNSLQPSRLKLQERVKPELGTSYYLSHEMGIPLAEIARHVGVCTSAVAKAVGNLEYKNEK